MPTFNSEKYIKKTIKSIYDNNFITGDEIVVIDDCSSDKTSEILKKLKKEQKIQTLILLKKNVGEGQAKNIGIKKSKNKYFFCLDHDNILRDNSVNRLRSEIDKYAAVAFDTVKYFQFHPINVTHKDTFRPGLMTLREYEGNDNPGFHGNLLYQKKAWQKVKGFDRVVLESWNFMYKILLDKLKVYIVADSYYFHRYGHESAYTRAAKASGWKKILIESRPKIVRGKQLKYTIEKNTRIYPINFFLSTLVRKLINILRVN